MENDQQPVVTGEPQPPARSSTPQSVHANADPPSSPAPEGSPSRVTEAAPQSPASPAVDPTQDEIRTRLARLRRAERTHEMLINLTDVGRIAFGLLVLLVCLWVLISNVASNGGAGPRPTDTLIKDSVNQGAIGVGSTGVVGFLTKVRNSRNEDLNTVRAEIRQYMEMLKEQANANS